jgi:hypothetical protein
MDYRVCRIVRKSFHGLTHAALPRQVLQRAFRRQLGFTAEDADLLIDHLIAAEFLHEAPLWSYNHDTASVRRERGVSLGPSRTTVAAEAEAVAVDLVN